VARRLVVTTASSTASAAAPLALIIASLVARRHSGHYEAITPVIEVPSLVS